MQFIGYCKNSSQQWEGVVFLDDQGNLMVTNGFCAWRYGEPGCKLPEMVSAINLCEVINRLTFSHDAFGKARGLRPILLKKMYQRPVSIRDTQK